MSVHRSSTQSGVAGVVHNVRCKTRREQIRCYPVCPGTIKGLASASFSFRVRISFPSTFAAPSFYKTVLFRRNSACRDLSPQVQLLPINDRLPHSYQFIMPGPLFLKWGPEDNPAIMTHRDLDILLTTKLRSDASDKSKTIFNIPNAKCLLTHIKHDAYQDVYEADLERILASLDEYDAGRSYLEGWNHLKNSGDTTKDDHPRQERANEDYKDGLRIWAREGKITAIDVENMPDKAIERLCVGLRSGTTDFKIAASLEKLFLRNAHLPGYRKTGPIIAHDVVGMRIYFYVTDNAEFQKWESMSVHDSAFKASLREFEEDLK